MGASNLGHIILYTVLNQTQGLLCDRAYFPGGGSGKGGRLKGGRVVGGCWPGRTHSAARLCGQAALVRPYPSSPKPGAGSLKLSLEP